MSSRVRLTVWCGLILATGVVFGLIQPSTALAGGNNFRSAVGGISIG